MARQMNLGRRKIELKLIACKRARMVAFSKRRSGIFKKAKDLSTLTGCEIAVVVISQTGRSYSFGHPSVERVIQRFHQRAMPVAQPAGGPVTLDLNEEYNELRTRLDRVKGRHNKLVEARMSARVDFCLGTPIHELSYDQLINAKECLNKRIEEIEKRIVQVSLSGSGKRTRLNGNVPDLNFAPSEDQI